MHKVIALAIEITQDDIDYLKFRAEVCLKNMAKARYLPERIRQWRLFTAYHELWLSNRDRV